MAMALEGIKVLDLSRLAPGPYCSMLLADFGADVTLVEAVPGANAKLAGPAADPEAAKRAAAYNALGRGKRSIALNLKNEAAREVFYELVKGADVVLEGFRPGVVNRLGVDYDTLSAINPRIVYCSLSGFGQTGPYSNLVGHDINYISIGGALGVIGRPGDRPRHPREPPRRLRRRRAHGRLRHLRRPPRPRAHRPRPDGRYRHERRRPLPHDPAP